MSPAILLLDGLGGLAWAIKTRSRFGILMGVCAGLAFALLSAVPSRTELDIVWVLLPLTLLAGLALEYLIESLQRDGDWLSEGLHVPVVVLLWCHLYLVLGRYAAYGNRADLALAALTIALQGLLTVIFALATKVGAALRALASGTGIVLLAVEISLGWGVAQVRPSDPRELLVGESTAVEVRDLIETLSDLSWRRTGLPFALPFTWRLRPIRRWPGICVIIRLSIRLKSLGWEMWKYSPRCWSLSITQTVQRLNWLRIAMKTMLGRLSRCLEAGI